MALWWPELLVITTVEFRMPLPGMSGTPNVLQHFLISRIETQDPGCCALRCAAHTFQLLLGDLTDTPLVRGAVQTMESLLTTMEDRGIAL